MPIARQHFFGKPKKRREKSAAIQTLLKSMWNWKSATTNKLKIAISLELVSEQKLKFQKIQSLKTQVI